VKSSGAMTKRHRVRARTEDKGTDAGKLWIPEEIGHRRHEDDPLCKSDMAQETLNRTKPDQGQGGTRNLERTDAREETTGATGM
jgi:hypothetical protein